MSDTKHTPGPWRIEYSDSGNILVEFDYYDEHGNRHSGNVCLVDAMRGPRNVANAHLIAAAPELLEALKRAHACATLQSDGTCSGCFVSEAIAKAEGR